ncbi:N-terminal double-transmembrane domain protein [Rhodovulum sulfidophilum]|uniref:N-terminal double-transmembrane domain protein n=1 Tax=Rhodovulum sulfidophilum TaxID=35806 RepID=A0A0D6B649_RHOSU|nr:N-terminal double-transmembrane domain protein [Rhodovulum sulfidophilum]
MAGLGALGFTAPLLLWGLVLLPTLWFLLRAVPPAPIRRRFPGVALLLGLADDEAQADRTPWWLLLLRMLAVAALILGFAGPVLNPQERTPGQGPLLVLLDGSWADARDWPRRIDRLEAVLDEAGRDGRPVAVVLATDLPGDGLPFQAAELWAARLAGVQPAAWLPDPEAVAAWADGLEGRFDTVWLSGGLDWPGRTALLSALERHGRVGVLESQRPLMALRPAAFSDGTIALSVLRARPGPETEAVLAASGRDPAGVERVLARLPVTFAPGETRAGAELVLPPELRNRISRFAIEGVRSAGAVSLTDDSLKRREVALIAGNENREGLQLLSPLHYLHQALAPTADLIEGTLGDVVLAHPDVIVLADVATLSPAESEALQGWVEDGGMLLRFAGPRLAASDVSRAEEDPLMPVRLRAGGRTVGGAMSWGEPKTLRPFGEASPFFGLPVPDDVRVNAQVMAQPDPSLADRSIAALSDGTPLVTRKKLGKGEVVLFHVTANAEWSTLPLSGLFVQMLERLAVSTRPARPDAVELAGTTWVPETVLDAFGALGEAGALPGVPGEALAEARPGPGLPPGLYAGEDRRLAVNVIGADTVLSPAAWPARIAVEGFAVARETVLKGWVLALALALLAVDILASLWLSGRLRGARVPSRAGGAMVLALALLLPGGLRAEEAMPDDALALRATSEVVLAHVRTGDAEVDRIADAGLRGLSRKLAERTSIEPAAPIEVDLETDELSFFPFLYWPVTANQPMPSPAAYARLNRYLRTGGMILFDTRDADVAGYGGGSSEGRRLQQLARPLDIPPLEPIPPDHVLTRTFYLLQDFPGRNAGREVWVEAAPADAERVDGMPFRDLNDGVTPVVIGGNDWASAWAVDGQGVAMFPVGRGYAGERQREIAFRFGINLIMHVLTGNYKSDQVHVPALLDRLGQ